ncbi:hypothetical protein L0F63_005004, partial [Massospora cicadina]
WCKPKKGKAGNRKGQAEPSTSNAQEASADQKDIIALKKEIMDIIAPFTSYDIPDTVTLSEFDNPLMVDSSLESVQLSGDHSSDNMLGIISGVTTPEKKSNLQKMDKSASSKSRVAEPSVKESCAKKKSLLVTLAIPEITGPPTRIHKQSAGESSKKVSREPVSPIRASKHAASENLASSPKRPRNTVSTGITARDSANSEASCRPARSNAIPDYNREAYLQSQRPLYARVCELPSKKETTQKCQHKSQQVSEFIKQELSPAIQFQEVKHCELLQESNSSQNLALETKTSSRSRPQEQRVHEALFKAPTTKTRVSSSHVQVGSAQAGPVCKSSRPEISLESKSRQTQIYSTVTSSSSNFCPGPPGGSAEARAATAALTAPAIPRKGVPDKPHRPCTFIFPIIDPAQPLPLPIVPTLPGRHSENLPSKKYFELLDEYRKKYLLNARDTYHIGKTRLNQKNPLAIATLVDSLMWYCNGFHYHELSGVSSAEEMIEQWSTLFGLIDTCVAHFEAVADGAAVFGVLHYAKSMVCSRIAGLMAQLLVGTVDSSLAQHHCVMLKQANQAFEIATSILDTSYVRCAFPELWKHFESKGFAGYPPLRPPLDDSANLTYFGRYILYTYLQMIDMEEPTCLEDDMTCIGLPFLDPYI